MSFPASPRYWVVLDDQDNPVAYCRARDDADLLALRYHDGHVAHDPLIGWPVLVQILSGQQFPADLPDDRDPHAG